ncbi:hypothetical protein [Pseudomonas sp. PSPC2-3]|uniref:hypothetical protein n=1 Tax=Pseudomonas sp. PSPC2-3 TaxID=2804561 RepID=UPI002064CFCA|nr:MAG TPA: hypothetical protein [Caudoviricetes sp.]DAK77138.1 MAG TPA: hypothetical protein [Caudoviricetes sp.]
MKVIVTKLLGSAEVEFLRKGVVVHRERFTGKVTSECRRTIAFNESFDDHRCRFVTAVPADQAFQYEVAP